MKLNHTGGQPIGSSVSNFTLQGRQIRLCAISSLLQLNRDALIALAEPKTPVRTVRVEKMSSVLFLFLTWTLQAYMVTKVTTSDTGISSYLASERQGALADHIP